MSKKFTILCSSSVAIVLASILASIITLYTVVAPHIKDQAHVASFCTVTDIKYQHTSCVNNSCSVCVVVLVSYIDIHGNKMIGYMKHRDISPYHNADKNDSKCFTSFTPSKESMNFQNNSLYFAVGSTMLCHFKTFHPIPSRLSSSTLVMVPSNQTLQAILWPSVFFIIGLVGIFFSAIFFCEDMNEKNMKRSDFCISVSGNVTSVV